MKVKDSSPLPSSLRIKVTTAFSDTVMTISLRELTISLYNCNFISIEGQSKQ